MNKVEKSRKNIPEGARGLGCVCGWGVERTVRGSVWLEMGAGVGMVQEAGARWPDTLLWKLKTAVNRFWSSQRAGKTPLLLTWRMDEWGGKVIWRQIRDHGWCQFVCSVSLPYCTDISISVFLSEVCSFSIHVFLVRLSVTVLCPFSSVREMHIFPRHEHPMPIMTPHPWALWSVQE